MPLPFSYHRLVVGYHGCDRSVVEGVLLHDKPLAPSNNRFDWLGKGIYFWEHGPRRALEFAQWKKTLSCRQIACPTLGNCAQDPQPLGAVCQAGRCELMWP